jgi:2-polyprenyl-6-methoxyphenol hydroxylase-like FAD-dependent oxidoreductase
MFMCVNQSASSMEDFRQAAKEGEIGLRQFVAKRFENVGWVTSRVLQEMEKSSEFYASEISQVKLPTLHQNRIVCVGDAGYAAGPTGGGTSLALAGGYFLAGELLAHRNDVDAGLKEYEKRMRPLISEMQKIPPFVGTIMAPQTSWGIALRNWVFAVVAWSGLAEWAQRYLGPAFEDGSEVGVEEYEWVR